VILALRKLNRQPSCGRLYTFTIPLESCALNLSPSSALHHICMGVLRTHSVRLCQGRLVRQAPGAAAMFVG
jgi:hypothetical protein